LIVERTAERADIKVESFSLMTIHAGRNRPPSVFPFLLFKLSNDPITMLLAKTIATRAIDHLTTILNRVRHHMRRSGQIGIAHAEVDDIFAPTPRLHLHAVDDAEDIGRQPFDALKFHASRS
jgi:hypothetical protein